MTDKKQGTTRRSFLKIAGTAVPGAVAAVATGATAAQAEPAQVDLSSQVMQDTEHTRAYLKSTRF
ncbi:twin-arginine translocation pathway signal protein [Aliiroseovarius sediminis]|uniref:twin-arginine translocation pathway signal protein n=1 Tax=Aliiroseovarius sediminis TaxID=2925839 RepID=UPI001F58421E|nr:twin-arginine translocation pathway signal protein [Aliiroseovarius sediminis]MCI2393748.1 twin-arginine translocation pathway signal protein [Aliiroseovarius sediminis]